MTVSIFETASKMKLTFATSKGLLDVNDLWDLPLQSSNKVNLDDMAKEINSRLKESEVVSFVTKSSSTNVIDKLRLDILKRIIEVRVQENEHKANERKNAERKQMILNALADKRVESLTNMTEDELLAQLNELK